MTWACSVWMWNRRVSSVDTLLRLAQELGLWGELGSRRGSERPQHTGGAAPAAQTPWDVKPLASRLRPVVHLKWPETTVLPECPWRVHCNKEASRWSLESPQVLCHQVQHSFSEKNTHNKDRLTILVQTRCRHKPQGSETSGGPTRSQESWELGLCTGWCSITVAPSPHVHC